MGKVAAIGTVNPRPGGLVNSLVQAWKRFVARVLDWHVREQVEFNRAAMECVESAAQALNESNRTLTAPGGRIANEKVNAEINDIRAHWIEWRQEWEQKLLSNEPVPAQRGRSASRVPAPRDAYGGEPSRSYKGAALGVHQRVRAVGERHSRRSCGRIWRRCGSSTIG